MTLTLRRLALATLLPMLGCVGASTTAPGTVTGVAPASGPTGGPLKVTLQGTGLQPSLTQDLGQSAPSVGEAVTVTLDGQPVAAVFKSATALEVTLPATLALGDHALAATRGGVRLEGSATYTAQHPLTLTVQAPATATTGQTFTAHVQLVNAAAAELSVALTGSATGSLTASTSQALTVPAGGTKLLDVSITAAADGVGTFSVAVHPTVSGLDLPDLVQNVSVTVAAGASSSSASSSSSSGSTAGTIGSIGSSGSSSSSGSIAGTIGSIGSASSSGSGSAAGTIGSGASSSGASSNGSGTSAGSIGSNGSGSSSGSGSAAGSIGSIGSGSIGGSGTSAGSIGSGSAAGSIGSIGAGSIGSGSSGGSIGSIGAGSIGSGSSGGSIGSIGSGSIGGTGGSVGSGSIGGTGGSVGSGSSAGSIGSSGSTGAPGPVSASNSSVVPDHDTVVATPGAAIYTDGIDSVRLTISVRDASNLPISGAAITTSSTDATNTFSPASGVTDSNGVLVTDVFGRTAGSPTLTITASGVTLPTQVVTFTSAARALPAWVDVGANWPAPQIFPVAAAWSDGLVYVLGGEDGSAIPSSSVDTFDPVLRKWTTHVATLPTSRSQAAVFATAGIDVVGGRIADGGSSAVDERLMPATTFSTMPALPGPRLGLAAAVGASAPFVLGGYDGNGVLTGETDRFDGVTWSATATTITPRAFLAGVSSGSFIYALGGRIAGNTAVATVEALDTSNFTASWSARKPMPTARAALGAVTAADGRIYAIGGDSTASTSAVEAYDPSRDFWVPVAPLLSPRDGAAAVVASSGDVLLIGGTRSGAISGVVEQYGPVVAVTPAASALTVSGSNFAPFAAVTFVLDGTPRMITATTDASGTLPSTSLAGPFTSGSSHTLVTTDRRSRYPVTNVFFVP